MRRWLARLLRRECEHRWGGWWVDDETGHASRSCMWCDATEDEQMAVHRPAHRSEPGLGWYRPAGRIRFDPTHMMKETYPMDNLFRYAKSVVAVVGTVVTLAQAALADQAVSLDEAQGIWTAVLAGLTVLGVWAVPNKSA